MRRVVCMFLLSTLLSLPLHAQQTGASLSGYVTDPSGAAVADAKIVITSTNTGSIYSTASTAREFTESPFVTVGQYTLTAEKAGFRKALTFSKASRCIHRREGHGGYQAGTRHRGSGGHRDGERLAPPDGVRRPWLHC